MALTVSLCSAPPVQNSISSSASRDAFLKKVDAALAARDARAILALSDVDGWRAAGHGAPEPQAMTLPDGPFERERTLSDSEVLYTDARGRSWKLELRAPGDHGPWAIVLRDHGCPRGGTRRAPEFESPAAPDNPPTWTPLECWPLPV